MASKNNVDSTDADHILRIYNSVISLLSPLINGRVPREEEEVVYHIIVRPPLAEDQSKPERRQRLYPYLLPGT